MLENICELAVRREKRENRLNKIVCWMSCLGYGLEDNANQHVRHQNQEPEPND